MERRKEPRFKFSKKITLKVLARMSGPSLGKHIEGLIVDASGSGMQLQLPVSVPPGAPVEIQEGGMLIHGEVSRCVADQDGFAVGIRVTQRQTAPEPQKAASQARR